MNPSVLPRGVALLFSVGDRRRIKVNEDIAFRTDKAIESTNEKLKKELLNNWLSNTSPITFKKGKEYYITDELFNAYFRRF